MKILIIGNTRGQLNRINEYIIKTNADFVLCTGDFGVLYKNDNTKLPKFITDNQFYQYLYGNKKFLAPIYSVRGPHDNLSLIRQFYNNYLSIPNFNIIKDGNIIILKKNKEIVKVGGLGGSYSPKYYTQDKLFGYEKRHFNYRAVDNLKESQFNILLLFNYIY